MKHKFIFLALTAMMLVLFGCNNNHTTNENPREDNIELLSDTLKSHLFKQDSLSQELVQQVDTLTQELNIAKSEIVKLQAVDSQKTPSVLWDILPLLLGIFALIGVLVVGWLTRHDVESESVKSIVNSHLRKTGVSELKERVLSLNRAQQGTNDNIASLQGRIAELERKIAELERKSTFSQQEQKPMPSISPAVHEKVQPSVTKRLYAKSANGKLLTEITETKQETSAFVIELMSDTKGIFDIVSFRQIKQMNISDDLVDYKGSCKLEEATDYETIHKGECEKQASGYWKVTKELEITISK